MAANSSTLMVMCRYGQKVQFLFGLQHHYILCNSQIEQEVVECLRQVSLSQSLNGHHVLAFRCGNCGQRPVNTIDTQLDYKYNHPGYDAKFYAIYIQLSLIYFNITSPLTPLSQLISCFRITCQS